MAYDLNWDHLCVYLKKGCYFVFKINVVFEIMFSISLLVVFSCQVENLVAIELSYINTKHPDFTEAHLIHRSMTDSSEEFKRHAIQQREQVNRNDDRVITRTLWLLYCC